MAQNPKGNKNKQIKQVTQQQQQSYKKKSQSQRTNKRSADRRKPHSRGMCRRFFYSVILLAVVVSVIVYDTEVNGKGTFAQSITGSQLRKAGVLPHVEKVWYTTMGTAARAYQWIEHKVVPFSTPFCHLFCDLCKVLRLLSCNIFTATKDTVNSSLPRVTQFLEQYIPGVTENLETTTDYIKTSSSNAYNKLTEFFTTQVFVGRFSPDNMKIALNQTQNLMLHYYNQFHGKVDAYAKLK